MKLSSLQNFFTFSTASINEDWAIWEEWQRNQPQSHYKKSEIFTYFIRHNPGFIIPDTSAIHHCGSEQYEYCFGEFTKFLIVNNQGGDFIEYFTLLLKLYDTCKGSSRWIRGDPQGINILRQSVIKSDLSLFSLHDLTQYAYDYTKIHAHTVVQYSISTLIMLFVSHYFQGLQVNSTCKSITLNKCTQCQQSLAFIKKNIIPKKQQVQSVQKSDMININRPIQDSSLKMSSCPNVGHGGEYFGFKCHKCSRTCEGIWGDYDVCIDCYVNRICLVCGNKAIMKATDGLPRCYDHSN